MGSLNIFTMFLGAILAQAVTPPAITLPAGDTARGKTIVEGNKGNCLSCHRINGTGSRFGPDLSVIGAPPRGGGGGRGGGAAPAAGAAARGAAVPPVPAAPATETTQRQLAQSILDPNALVAATNRYVTLTMKD